MSGELSVDYLGLELSSPVVIGACPLTKEPETVRQLIQAGAGAIVLPSILQEQIVHRRMKTDDPLGALSHSGYQPQQDHYNGGADGYLQTIEELRKLFDVPVIASLNGSSEGQWLGFAKEIESAGAHAIEFNLQQVVYRHGPDAIRDMVDGIRRHVEWSHHPTLREFLAARPVEPVNEERFMRMEYVDPLTRSETYFDPTPEVSPQFGDAYGHQI